MGLRNKVCIGNEWGGLKRVRLSGLMWRRQWKMSRTSGDCSASPSCIGSSRFVVVDKDTSSVGNLALGTAEHLPGPTSEILLIGIGAAF